MSRRGDNIHKRKDGRWEGRYIKCRNENNKAVYASVYGKTYAEVRIKLDEAKLNIQFNDDYERIKFSYIADLWLSTNRIHIKAATYNKYYNVIETHIKPVLGNLDINEISSTIINQFLEEKMLNGKLDGSGGLSPTYVNTIAIIVNSIVNFAVKEGYCNPLSTPILKPTPNSNSPNALSNKEYTILTDYNTINSCELFDSTLIIMFFYKYWLIKHLRNTIIKNNDIVYTYGDLMLSIDNVLACGCNQKNFAVIFDMDGVIFDSEKLSLNCWRILAKEHHLQNIEDVFFDCIGNSYQEAECKFNIAYGNLYNFKDFKKEKTDLYKQMYENNMLELKSGAIEILSFLKESGIKIGLATSTATVIVNKELRDYKIKQYFDVIICGDMVEKCKPSPDVYLKACKSLGYEPKNCYAIEDSYNGIIAAKRAGANVIMVPDLIKSDTLENTELLIIKQSLFDVIDYLKNILNGEK